INGVVRSLEHTAREAENLGADMQFLSPQGFRTVPLPTYNEIRLALATPRMIMRRIEAMQPDFVHIATEGPIGILVRRACIASRRTFTTSYHTRFPEYVRLRLPVPLTLSYAVMRTFHRPSRHVMAATPALKAELESRGFNNVALWSRGVDTTLFSPGQKSFFDLPRPVFLYMGRVAVEKNIEAFLSLDLPGSKVVVGDGPARNELERKYRDARFCGMQTGAALAAHVAAADVFVFPSLTDTFGVVLLEAMACGVPVAAYPVTGPQSVVTSGYNGCLDHDLRRAALRALTIPAGHCRGSAMEFSWEKCTRQFLANLVICEKSFAHSRLTDFSLKPNGFLTRPL
ncbi:MAG: glycosyltransferase family 1 protein, partial [Desulfobulbaceae bacterium]